MRVTTVKIDTLEQLVILEALEFTTRQGHFEAIEKANKGRVSLIAWKELAARTKERLKTELGYNNKGGV